MLLFHANALLNSMHNIERNLSIARTEPEWLFNVSENLDFTISQVDRLASELKKLDLQLSLKSLDDFRIPLGPGMTAPIASRTKLLQTRYDELFNRVVDELEVRSLYYVSGERAVYLHDTETPFGKDVADKFPNASADIAEASKSLGFSRNTACVFHLMRAMEECVRVMGNFLSVTVIKKDSTDLEWGLILANMKAPIEAMQGAEKNNWSEVFPLLYHVKNCWRNATMHPKQTYTDEEAAEVYNAVKSFIRRAAKLI